MPCRGSTHANKQTAVPLGQPGSLCPPLTPHQSDVVGRNSSDRDSDVVLEGTGWRGGRHTDLPRADGCICIICITPKSESDVGTHMTFPS